MGRCDRRMQAGWPHSAVWTAAAKGMLLDKPRPALASSRSDRPFLPFATGGLAAS